MSIQASRNNAISLQVAIEEYFRDNNLDEEITDYDFGNGAFTEWHFYCEGDDFKYIDDNVLYDYISDLREFRDENFEVFSFRDEISVKILDDEFEESKKSARKSLKESRGQTVAELLQNALPKTKIHIYSDSTGDEFEGTKEELKGEYSRFLYYMIYLWYNDKIIEIFCN